MINQYFIDIENIINNVDFIISSEIQKRKINDFLGIIEGKLHFSNGILDVLEVIVINDDEIFKKKYKYHFRDYDNNLVFRYDNAPHHPMLKTFPHHKHTSEQLLENSEITINEVLSEIKEQLGN